MSATLGSRKRARAATTPVTEANVSARQVTIRGGIAMAAHQIRLWREGKMCDATVTAMGRDFPVHRSVLCASEFFEGAFACGMTEGLSAHVQLPEVAAPLAEAVITFLYTGECRVPEAELTPLFEAAAYLRVQSLSESIATELIERLAPHNCLDAWSLADTHSFAAFATAAKEEALLKFEAVALTDSLTALPHERLLELLNDERLTVAREEAVYDAVMRWALARAPPPTDDKLLALLCTVRYPLMAPDFFDRTVMCDTRLQSVLGARVAFSALRASMYGPPIARRPGFGPSRPSLTWSTTHKGSRIEISGCTVASTQDDERQSACSAEPLPTTGKHLVEIVYERTGSEIRRSLGGGHMTGLLSAEKMAACEFSENWALCKSPVVSGFYGVDDYGAGHAPAVGVFRGREGTPALDASKTALPTIGGSSRHVLFVSGDRIGLLVDMDARTLTILRNGVPIPSLVIDGLPRDLYVAVTPCWRGSTARLVHE